MKNNLLALVVALTTVLPLYADSSARTILYHSKDIVNIRAKVKYTTLIQLPATEKIIEAATGDKEFWIIDVVGSFCFVHPAKKDIRSNLNLITDKGNIYSFTLEDVTDQQGDPDLKVIVQPSDQSSIVASSGPPEYVPASQVTAIESQLQGLQSHVNQVVDEYKASYPTEMKFDYTFAAGKAPFNVTAIYHDAKFTYINRTPLKNSQSMRFETGHRTSLTTSCGTELTSSPRFSMPGISKLAKRKWNSPGRCSHERRCPSNSIRPACDRTGSDEEHPRAARCLSSEPEDAGLPRDSSTLYCGHRGEFVAPQDSSEQGRSEYSSRTYGSGCIWREYRGDAEGDRKTAGRCPVGKQS